MSDDELISTLQTARLLAYGGRDDDAMLIVSNLRSNVAIHSHPCLASEVLIVEGIALVASADWNSALDRFRRGALIGQISGQLDSSNFATIWSSHCLFNLGRVGDAVDQAIGVIVGFREGRVELKHRICVVMAEIWSYAENRVQSDSWFEASRMFAGRIASRGLFSASLFNMCALRVWESTLIPRLFGRPNKSLAVNDLLLLESSVNYDKLTGVSSRLFLHQLLRAQLLSSLGECRRALAILDSLLKDERDIGGFEPARITLERAWCLLEIDAPQPESLLIHLRKSVSSCLENLCEEDDLAFAHLLLLRIDRLTHGDVVMSTHGDAVCHYSKMLRQKQDEVRMKLNGISMISPSQLDVDSIP